MDQMISVRKNTALPPRYRNTVTGRIKYCSYHPWPNKEWECISAAITQLVEFEVSIPDFGEQIAAVCRRAAFNVSRKSSRNGIIAKVCGSAADTNDVRLSFTVRDNTL